MTKITQFQIKTLGNLHVGSGEQNFGVIDNLVQKDPITEIPMINSSSLKGAIKDHFVDKGTSLKKIKIIFGDTDGAGEVKFLQARLLALPVRSNRQMYFLATTPQILEDYVQNHKILAKEKIEIEIPDMNADIYISTNDTNCYVEDYEADNTEEEALKKISEKLFDNQNIALIKDEVFKTISLPIITRNKIAKTEDDDNNLFYEEVIPRHTIFSAYIITPTDIDREDRELEKIFTNFINAMKTDNIQIGANASIGYGLCQFKEV